MESVRPTLREIALASEVSRALSPDLLPAGSRVLLACSGGVDSTALALAAAARASDLSIEVVLGHVDHALRPDSAEDAGRVRALAEELEVPFHGARLPCLAAEIRALGLEAAARDARYRALEGLGAAGNCDRIATAHTQTDQAETILLRLARGAGPAALAGARRFRTLGAVRLVRPLLGVSRSATEALCAASGLSIARDPHNSDPRRARARLRALWPTLLTALGPHFEEALARSARIAADEDEVLKALTEEALAQAACDGGLDARALALLPAALARRCLLAASAGVLRPERSHLERMVVLLTKEKAAVDVPGGRFRITSGVLRIEAGPKTVQPEGRLSGRRLE
jgi:tRNA(Ile)-lysidine synthase